MQILDKERVMCFDVDDTLVMWQSHWRRYDRRECVAIDDPYCGGVILLKPNYDHIRLLRKSKARGAAVVVWSHGGFRWAEAVIKGLGLTMYVDVIMSKPDDYVDDIPIENWGLRNLYIKNGYGISNETHE